MSTQNLTRMPFYLPGSPRFVQALQLFLQHTNEYEVLRPWYSDFLKTIPRKERYLDIGTGNGGSLTNQADAQFTKGYGIEKNKELLVEIRKHCPNILLINKQWEDVTDEQLLEFLAQNDPTVEPSSDGVFDLIQLVHFFYYLPTSEHSALLQRLMKFVRPGGVILACLQDETSEYHALYHQFAPNQYNLRELGEWFDEVFGELGMSRRRREWEVTSEVLPGEVATDSFEIAQQMAEFMLCYVKFDPLPLQAQIEKWVKEKLWKPDRALYIAQNPQRVLVCRRLH